MTSTSTPARQSDRLYHELLAPKETQSVRAAVRRIAEQEVAPHAAAIANGDERTDGFPRQVFDALASAGVFRIPFPARSAATV
jgi:butyryl-CoA dehydrogenase